MLVVIQISIWIQNRTEIFFTTACFRISIDDDDDDEVELTQCVAILTASRHLSTACLFSIMSSTA